MSGMNAADPRRYSMSVQMYRGGGGGGGSERPRTAPPDLPSLLLDARICYLGMPVRPSCLEKPIYLLLCFLSLRSGNVSCSFSAFYLQIVPAVTELLVAQFMWLDYDNPAKPIYLYINSPGTQVSTRSLIRYCFFAGSFLSLF